MIKTLTIKSFKSFVDPPPLSLGMINVFVGANGSGKSNLLEAIGILGAAAFGRVDDESLDRRGVRPGVPSLYKTAFADVSGTNDIRFTAEASDASYEVGLFNPPEAPEPAWRFNTERLQSGNRKVAGRSNRSGTKLNPEAGLAALKLVDLDAGDPAAKLMEVLRTYAIYSPDTPTLRGLAKEISREPVGLHGGRLPEAFEELQELAKTDEGAADVVEEAIGLIDWVRRVSVVPAGEARLSPSVASGRVVLQFHDRFMGEGSDALTAADASEGALYVVLAAVLAAHPKSPRCLAVDNFDHGLNPRLAKALIGRFCEWTKASGRQVLLTSHNPLVLDGLPLADDQVRLFVVDRLVNGHSMVHRIEIPEIIEAKVKAGKAVLSQLWLTGALGGMPSV